MLHRTGNTASDIELGANRHPGLADLAFVFDEAGIHRSAGRPHFAAQDFGQLVQQLEVFTAADPVTARNDNLGALDVHLLGFDGAVDDLAAEIGIRHILGYIHHLHNALVTGLVDFLLHHPFANRGHLGTGLRVDNRGDDVAAESRTNLIKQVLIDGVGLLFLVIPDFQGSTVGRQPAQKVGSHARCHVTAYRCSPEQQDFGLEFLGQTYHNRGMGQGGEREQAGIVGIVDHIHAVGIQCLFQLLDLASDHNGFQLAAQGVGQFAALGEQFQAHVSNAAFFGYFAIYKYVTHFFLF